MQKQTQAIESELQSLKMAAVDEAKYLQLAESLAGFRSKVRVRAEALDIAVRQQILRLLVKEVLVGGNTITLRHSIPIPQSGPGSNGSRAGIRRHWIKADPRLSFAFGESLDLLAEFLPRSD